MAFNKLSMLMVMAAIFYNSVSADPDLLQDVCVADLTSSIKVNGYPCREPFTAEDFFFAGLAAPGVINTTMGAVVTPASVQKLPGLNALGISMARIDYTGGGLNPPHLHPRASELAYVLEGELEMGFVTTRDVLISKVMKKGELFVFPKGLVHYQKNNKKEPAALLVAFNSQFPGTQPIAPTLFGATPPVPDNVLSMAFQVDQPVVTNIKGKFAKK
ncbi:germin-like protein subfamily 2 member 1 [Apium graveolens]|uniref:germin-like protein subfamily 2 member 1 n=1 Tax=Apium graveolens TaxID=4045 RepID=UPI003D7B9707